MPSSAGTEALSSDTRQHYRPYLDGLRTVAVYVVVAYHAGLGLLSGGFIGVDIFFVLSGFLVTGILVRDLVSGGRIRLQQFYSRRARRILPASIVVLLVTAILYTIIATPAEALDALGGFRAAFVYIANWYFVHQATDYFAVNVNRSPVLHFWSLAVEEQFYLVWPMVLAGLFFITRRSGRWRWWALRGVLVVCISASAIEALHIASTNLDRAYYGTDTRAYQLLAGAALALTPQLLHLRSRTERVAEWVSTLAFAVVLLLATSLLDVGPITRGVLAAGSIVVLLVAIENAHGGVVKHLLSSPLFTYLGRISYGVYLWHWPVIIVASRGRDLSPVELFAIATPTATALAALSFHLFEHPIRVADVLDRFKGPIIIIGFTTSILCGLLVVPPILRARSDSGSLLAGTGTSTSGLKLLDWRVAKNDFPTRPECVGKPLTQCNVVAGKRLRVVLAGDSNAWMWIPTFKEIAKERGWDFYAPVFPACPWQQNLLIPPNKLLEACAAHQAVLYNRVIPDLNPDLIILATQSLDNPDYPYRYSVDGKQVGARQPTLGVALAGISAKSLKALQRPGRQIIILEPVPQAPPDRDPLECLSGGGPVASCAFQANLKPTPLELFYRQEAKQPDITSIDLDHLVCPRWPMCDAIVGDIIVRPDTDHVTATFALSLAPNMSKLIPG